MVNQQQLLKRGRPNKEVAAKIDHAILSAGWTTFIEFGFEGSTMELIAKRAGVTRVTLYSRHWDKLALLKACAADRIAKWSSVAQQTDWMLGDTLEQRLTHYGKSMLLWSQNAEVVAIRSFIMESRSAAGAVARDLVSAIIDPMVSLLTNDIAAYGAREGITAHDPREAALLFLGMLEAVRLEGERLGQTAEAVSDKAPRVVAVLLHGIAHVDNRRKG